MSVPPSGACNTQMATSQHTSVHLAKQSNTSLDPVRWGLFWRTPQLDIHHKVCRVASGGELATSKWRLVHRTLVQQLIIHLLRGPHGFQPDLQAENPVTSATATLNKIHQHMGIHSHKTRRERERRFSLTSRTHHWHLGVQDARE